MSENATITGVILAGGLARRMGNAAAGDKALLQLAGKPILEHVIARLKPQCGQMVINANGDPARFSRFGLPVAGDPVDGFAGPLAGVLAGMDWSRANAPSSKWILTVACDTPLFPVDLVHRLSAAGGQMACASSGGRRHPVFGLWPVGLAGELRHALINEAIRKVDLWTSRYDLTVAEFATAPFDPFFNANRPEDIAEAERLLQEVAA